jgi:tetratricopeptide (TPR) repeat protein
MKAEHRKESPAHAVRQRVGRLLNDLKARPSTSSLIFWLVLLLVVVLVAGWYVISRQEKERASTRWLKYDESTTVEDLEALARDHPGTTAATAARFEQARLLLRQGLDKYAASEEKERAEAQDKLKKAADLYEQLAKEASAYPLLVQEAFRGAAKARESLGDLDGALKDYEQLASAKPETEVTRAAAEAVKNLKDPDTRKKLETFYSDLKQLTSAKPLPPAEKP